MPPPRGFPRRLTDGQFVWTVWTDERDLRDADGLSYYNSVVKPAVPEEIL